MFTDHKTTDALTLDVGAVYQRVRAEISTTDDISFKLMGLVPLISGAGLLSLIFSDKVPALAGASGASPSGATAVTALCLFAAAVTLGLFRWELRNVQACNWLIARAHALEARGLAALDLDARLLDRPRAPDGIGKEIAEKSIYGVTVAVWLTVPVAIGAFDRSPTPWQFALGAVALAIGTATLATIAFSSAALPLLTPIPTRFATKMLPAVRDAVAPDGSDVRVLLGLATGGMAHFELAAHATSKAIRHRNVQEIWFFLSGSGEMWRLQDSHSEFVPVSRGACITIPSGTHFQFRSLTDEPLRAIGVTMPPWPGEQEAIPVTGIWPHAVE